MRAAVILLICAALAFVGFIVAGTRQAHGRHAETEAFLRQIADGHTSAAYDSATENFKRRFPWEEFEQFVANFRLNQYRPGSLEAESAQADVDWSKWREGFSLVELNGPGELRDGTRLSFALRLRPERGVWRVDYLYVTAPRRPAASPAGTNDAPQAEHPSREGSAATAAPLPPSSAGPTHPADASPTPAADASPAGSTPGP